jgi:hypothetical protein
MTTDKLMQNKTTSTTRLDVQIEALENYIKQKNTNEKKRRTALNFLEKCEMGLDGENKAFRILNELNQNFPIQILRDVSFQNLAESDKTTQIDLLLITDKLIFVIEVKNWEGVFEVKNGLLYNKTNAHHQYMNPYKQNEYHIENLRELLSKGGFENIRFDNIVYWANDDGHIEFDTSDESAVFQNAFLRTKYLTHEIMRIYDSTAASEAIRIEEVSQYLTDYCLRNPVPLFCPICKNDTLNPTCNPLTFNSNVYNKRRWCCNTCGYAEIDIQDAAFLEHEKITSTPLSSSNTGDIKSMKYVREYVLTEDEYKQMIGSYEDVTPNFSLREKQPKKWNIILNAITSIFVFAVAVLSVVYFLTLKPCMMCTEMGLYKFTERINELFHDYYINGFGKNTVILLIVLLLIGSTGFLTGYMGNSLRNLHGGYFLRDKTSWKLPVLLKYLPTFFMIIYHSIYMIWRIFIDDTTSFDIPKYQISLIGENYSVGMWITQIAVILALVSFIPIIIYAVVDSGFLGSLITIPVLIVSNCAMSIVMSLILSVVAAVLSFAALIVIGLIIAITVFIAILKAFFVESLYR